MINRNNIEKDLDNMTMKEIKEYVEGLKQTIYHMAETMEAINSSYNLVSKDLNEFNNIISSRKKSTSLKNSPINKLPKEPEFQNQTIDNQNNENYGNDELELDSNYPTEVTDPLAPYVFEFIFTTDKNNKKDSVIIGKDNYYIINSIEPDQYNEIITQTEYSPNFYFETMVNVSVLKLMWETFLQNYPLTGDIPILESIHSFDSNQNVRVLF